MGRAMNLSRRLVLLVIVLVLAVPRVEAQQQGVLTPRQIVAAGVVVVGAVILIAVLAKAGSHSKSRPRAEPCSAPVAPIQNTNILITVYNNYTYNLRDPQSKDSDPAWFVDRLNQDGAVDRNHFALANGQPGNFTLTFTFS